MTRTIASTLCISFGICIATLATGMPANAADHDKVTFNIDKWRKPGSNNAGLIDITVDNKNDFALTAIRLRCDYTVKAGGKKIEAEQTVPLKLKANTKKTFKKTKFPFIDTATADGSCRIIGATK
jgi:hypothetical protein